MNKIRITAGEVVRLCERMMAKIDDRRHIRTQNAIALKTQQRKWYGKKYSYAEATKIVGDKYAELDQHEYDIVGMLLILAKQLEPNHLMTITSRDARVIGYAKGGV